MDRKRFIGICILKNQLLNIDSKKIIDAYEAYEN